ncbi:hypothetical protein [Streptomyces sp. H34-S4]|nr:hypothetical protein [Streptomyces sp. H34-S4]MCY0939300.1 hypothetical protein [Streptomyces sp. H34-S4]
MLLKALRRAIRKAAFDAPVSFDPGADPAANLSLKEIRAHTEGEI